MSQNETATSGKRRKKNRADALRRRLAEAQRAGKFRDDEEAPSVPMSPTVPTTPPVEVLPTPEVEPSPTAPPPVTPGSPPHLPSAPPAAPSPPRPQATPAVEARPTSPPATPAVEAPPTPPLATPVVAPAPEPVAVQREPSDLASSRLNTELNLALEAVLKIQASQASYIEETTVLARHAQQLQQEYRLLKDSTFRDAVAHLDEVLEQKRHLEEGLQALQKTLDRFQQQQARQGWTSMRNAVLSATLGGLIGGIIVLLMT